MIRPPDDKRAYRVMCIATRRRIIRKLKTVTLGSPVWREMVRLIGEFDQIIEGLDHDLGIRE